MESDCVLVCMDLMECFKQAVAVAESLFFRRGPEALLETWV